MEITIFDELTTNDYLCQLEEDAKSYEGLYVDMDNAPERKYVKEKAQTINDLLKKLDRSRIDKSKAYKMMVEKEAGEIKARLEKANEPFTLLIDEHKAARAKILAEQKAAEDAKAAAIQKQEDHEIALLMNKTFEFDRAEEVRLQKERDEKIAQEAEARAIEQERQYQEKIKQDEINAENARLANVEHVKAINNSILSVLVASGISEDDAKKVIILAAKKQLPNLTINY